MVGTGGRGASGTGDLLLLLENLSAWPRLPLLLRRFENDFLRFMLGGSASSVGVLIMDEGVGDGRGGGRAVMLAMLGTRAVWGRMSCGIVLGS